MLKTPNSHNLLLSLLSRRPDIDQVTDFVLHIIYNRPIREKCPGESRYNMLTKKKKQGNTKKKYNTSKELPPDQSSLKMKILRASFTAHTMSNCLDSQYVPLDPSLFGWKYTDNTWKPVWFEGNPLPDPDDLSEPGETVTELQETDESDTNIRSGTDMHDDEDSESISSDDDISSYASSGSDTNTDEDK